MFRSEHDIQGIQKDHWSKVFWDAAKKRVLRWWRADRQIIFRSEGRVHFLHLNDVLKVVSLAVGLWILYASISYFVLRETIDEREVEIADGRKVYRELIEEVNASKLRFDALAEALERNDLQLVRRLGKNSARRSDLKKLRQSLKHGRAQRKKGEKTSSLEDSGLPSALLRAIPKRTMGLSRAEFAQVLGRTPEAVAPRGEVLNVAYLSSALQSLRQSQDRLVDRLGKRAEDDSAMVTELVAKTGLNVEYFLRKAQRRRRLSLGGPFIPLRAFGLSSRFERDVEVLESRLSRWERTQRLLRAVPMGAPLNHYYTASGYGKRRDPIRNRWALHGGIDLAANAGTRIYTMAPGRVRYAGWSGPFGRMIEIDHGLGVWTRYAHLKKILVQARQRVKYQQLIGLVGTSGRSTGPHLHYEIIVNRKRMNPTKFIKAGRNVFKG